MFCEKLREVRKRRGLTQEEIAKKLHMSSVGYGSYERGQREPGIETLKKLSIILNISIDELVENNRERTNEDCANEIIRLVKELSREKNKRKLGER